MLVVAYYYAKGFGWLGWNGSWFEDFFTDPLLYILILFVGFFFWINSDEDGSENAAKKRLKKWKTVKGPRRVIKKMKKY